MIALLQSKDKSTRILATEALGQIGPSAVDAVPFLLPELQGDTRVWVTDALGLMGQKDETLVSAINKTLTSKNSDDTTARSCVYILSKLRVPPVNIFLEAIKNENSERMTLLATRGPGVKAAVPALVKALRNQSFDVRHAAVTALGIIGPDASSSVPILVEMLDSKDTDRSVPNFVERVETKGTDRSEIILALRRIGPLAGEAIPSLLKLLEQPDTPDPSLIVDALSEIDPNGHRILNPLAKALDPNHPLVRERGAEFRQEVCLAFGRIGPLAQSAVPVLIATLGKDEQRLVQIEAAMALSDCPIRVAQTATGLG